ncbi:hypothetical protein FZC78_19250 [Rossellomorea vietnamensis]|uniref:Uncharacterized protein n=1 Tax=Rossellomorea vietnamensis TaxID=218284 RepID=A0A5D4NMY4_9BACI|nr:hypothetical protein [Rossellomorea vietnamensis]TYS14292.1 hypothetical protein FZC78_19250 [Rossellomorea vietnamensis]
MKIIYELGDKVKFSKHLIKNEGPNLEKLLEDDEIVDYQHHKYKAIEHNEMTGMIVGKRLIGKTSYLSYEENTYTSEFNWVCTDTIYQTVYLVATNMAGLNRVREEDIKFIGN